LVPRNIGDPAPFLIKYIHIDINIEIFSVKYIDNDIFYEAVTCNLPKQINYALIPMVKNLERSLEKAAMPITLLEKTKEDRQTALAELMEIP